MISSAYLSLVDILDDITLDDTDLEEATLPNVDE
jgi:hypothetical protein